MGQISESMKDWQFPGNKFRNKKNGKNYIVMKYDVLNSTNANDGQVMVLYYSDENPNQLYVRETEEFYQKFESIT